MFNIRNNGMKNRRVERMENIKRKGFPHEKQKLWRRGYYKFLQQYEIPVNLVAEFGDTLELVQGEILAPRVECVWIGGPVCVGVEGTLDLMLRVPSFSEKERSYKLAVKLDKSKFSTPNQVNIVKTPAHYCGEVGAKHITKLVGPCHHVIAAFKAMQDRLPKWCRAKGIEEKYFQRYKNYDYWLTEREPEEIIDLYEYLAKNDVPALDIREIILMRKMQLWNGKTG